jgi:hypothetical protein
MPTPNPILKLSAPLWPPLEPDPVADGTLCDGEEEEAKGVSARMLVAAAGVKPEKVSEMPRKESVVDVVTLTLRIRQGGLSCGLRGTCVMKGGFLPEAANESVAYTEIVVYVVISVNVLRVKVVDINAGAGEYVQYQE